MPRVFFATSVRFDTSSAKTFGDPHFLILDQRLINPLNGQQAYDALADALDEAKYDSKKDLIALTGPIHAVAFLLTAASSLSRDGNVQVLAFDARADIYRLRSINTLEVEDE